MAWTAPTTRSTGDLITASIWNTDLTDNLSYLKTQTDLIDNCSYTIYSAGGARAIDGTDYQNSSTSQIMVVVVSAANSLAGDGKYIRLQACVKSSSPPNTSVAYSGEIAGIAGVTPNTEVTFLVPPLYYYDCTGTATDTPTLNHWVEYLLH